MQKANRHLADRSWLFRTVGWGHDALVWKQIISALRMTGYDHVISIEHEDALASVDEASSPPWHSFPASCSTISGRTLVDLEQIIAHFQRVFAYCQFLTIRHIAVTIHSHK